MAEKEEEEEDESIDRVSTNRKNPKQFDLEGAYEEWRQKQSEKKEKTILDDSKRHVLDALKELIASKTLQEAAIVSMALQAVYDKISSTLTDAKIHTDVYTFINIALIWALSELELFDQDFERYFNTIVRLPEDFMLCSFTRTFFPIFSRNVDRMFV